MTEQSSCTPFEEKEIRCPRLGGPVTFWYCRREHLGKPCHKALDCWAAYFDVESFFRDQLTPEEFLERFHTPPQTKIVTLLDLIEKARKVAEQAAREKDKNENKNKG